MLDEDATQLSNTDILEESIQPTTDTEDRQEEVAELHQYSRRESLANQQNQSVDLQPQIVDTEHQPVSGETGDSDRNQINKDYESLPTGSEAPELASQTEPRESTEDMPIPEGNDTSNWMRKQSYNVYACSNMSNGPQNVLQLRKYYTQLDQEARTTTRFDDSKIDSETLTRRGSKRSRAAPLRSQNTFELNDPTETAYSRANMERYSTSVEELRKIFENAEDSEVKLTSCFRKVDVQEVNRSKSLDPIRSNLVKSIEFYTRPPKVRTPSPKHHQQLPTPPPLPLPPFPEHERPQYRHDSRFEKHQNPKPQDKSRRRRHYSSHWNQPAQPIISMSLPFRSRSLALDRLGDPTDPSKQPCRFRASSLTQRSLSPINLPSRKLKSTRSARPTVSSHMVSNGETSRNKVSVATNKVDISRENQVKPMADKSLARNGRVKTDPDHIIYINPAAADGVYIRSAVVYERVDDRNECNKPRNFLTTYVVSKGPSPSGACVQATNMWVAEQTLQQAKTNLVSAPHRTQAITNFENGISTKKPSAMPTEVKVPSCVVKEKCAAPRVEHTSKALRREEKVIPRPASVSPLPLPEPPPTDIHPNILRCVSRDCSPTETKDFGRRGRGIQFSSLRGRRSRPSYSPTGRAWSVKSLSPPPPFRTQWLSSLGGRKEHQVDQHIRLATEADASGNQGIPTMRCYSAHNKDQQCQTRASCYESYRRDRARRQAERQRREWMQRAEEIHRDRQHYHEFRGSWSPPQFRSPARHTPNNLEEPTEHEIRRYVRQQSPPSPAPKPFIPLSMPQMPVEYVQALDKSTQYVEPTNNYRREGEVMVDPNCIDTTPIAENFDEKKAFFEELIKTNKELARCSFCSDCFHCSPIQTPRWSAYSSWDSDLHETYKRNDEMFQHNYLKEEINNENPNQNTREKSCVSTQVPARNMFKYQVEDQTNSNPKYRVSHIYQQPLTRGPQQYASSIYLTSADPHQLEANTQLYDPTSSNKFPHHNSIQHDFYAKPSVAMPKVAPDPPNWATASTRRDNYTTQRRPLYTHPLRVELAHSPVNVNNNNNNEVIRDYDRYDYQYRPYVHSPPCRFSRMNRPTEYALQHDGSMESLHCDQYEQQQLQQQQQQQPPNQPFYRGRVRQLVQELDKRATEYGARMNSGESFSTPDLRRSLRRSESERFSYFMPQTSWQS